MERINSLSKDLLVVCNRGLATSNAQEALDLALAASAFDQNVGLLLQGDALAHLIKDQSPGKSGRKNTSKMLDATAIYGIEEVFVDASEFQTLPKTMLNPRLNVVPLSPTQSTELMRRAKCVVRL